MIAQLLSFAALAAVLVAVPGPAVLLVMKSVIVHGRRQALLTALGVYGGDLVWVVSSAVGLTAVLVASGPAFEALRYLGAAYLLYLGLRLLLQRHLPPDGPDELSAVPSSRRMSRRAFRQGALCELSNPKTALVFTSVMPQFVPTRPSAVELVAFGVVFASLGFASLVGYALVMTRARRIVRPRMRSGLLRAGGGLLAAFGVGLALERI
jgi:threonine/homoserine/homoserine lactone efflux protein